MNLLKKRKELLNKLYESVDYNSLTFKYIGPTKDVSFYECMNSKELFDAIKSTTIKFSDAKNKQNEFLNRLGDTKIGRKNMEQQEIINNLEKFYNSREQVINFFKDYTEMLLDAKYKAKKINNISGKELKILTPKQMLQRLPIALAQLKAGNTHKIY